MTDSDWWMGTKAPLDAVAADCMTRGITDLEEILAALRPALEWGIEQYRERMSGYDIDHY